MELFTYRLSEHTIKWNADGSKTHNRSRNVWAKNQILAEPMLGVVLDSQ